MLSTHKLKPYVYEYPHPAVASDIAIFTLRAEALAILLIERAEAPHKGAWALPGGFLRPDENLDACARRELAEETAVEASLLRQFSVFSDPDRDPRERVISVAYLALMQSSTLKPKAGSDAAAVAWFEISSLPALAFDHAAIIQSAIDSLRALLDASDILLALLPEKFTLSQMQAAHEIVMGGPVDKRNFRARVLGAGHIAETDEMERGAHRPARLYRRA